MTNIAGYSPTQWVFGKNPTDSEHLHDGGDLPFWSAMSDEERFNMNMQVRFQAEHSQRQFNLNESIKRAANSRVYYPGDIVYYKRYQARSVG